MVPALVEFEPDLILISAGFDAHKKDTLNWGYLAVQVGW
jgi:acetoin utilization deacetylase AcuC-like enzyme